MAIEILPAQLANQIAAGEVVERPASVIKELVENSLDAGASSIKIDVEKGGAKLIRIIDNGKGIPKDELTLALSRHATSKIKSLTDLEAISSLGFRGEALASISSVSRLTITSKPAEQEAAWQANAEGRDMNVTINPAAHPNGTTISVNDLFFNTPARRKFLRTEKTEFSHIEEVIRRIALARFDVSFVLTHNGKVVKQYRAARNQSQYTKRVAQICGQKFIDHAVEIECQHSDLRLWGWLAKPEFSRSQNDLAYSYVNGRMMRDKLINHAIRQAYADFLPSEAYPAFVLFLELDHREVDVNVHPAKHEVRFHQGRYIHDFIFSVCHQGINNQAPLIEQNTEQKLSAVQRSSAQPYAQVLRTAGVGEESTAPRQSSEQSDVYQQNQQHITESASQNQDAVAYNTDYITPLERVHTSSRANVNEGAAGFDVSPEAYNANSKSSAKAYGSNNHYSRDNLQKPGITPSAVNAYQQLMTTAEPESELLIAAKPEHQAVVGADSGSALQLLTITEQGFASYVLDGKIKLLAIAPLELGLNESLVAEKLKQGIVTQPLLLPIKLTVTPEQMALVEQYPQQWLQMGITVQKQSNTAIQVRKFPALLRQQDVSHSFFMMLSALEKQFEQLDSAPSSLNDLQLIEIFQRGLASALQSESYDLISAQAIVDRYSQQYKSQFIATVTLNSAEIDLTSAINELSK